MSKFYTYEELKEHPPSVETVAKARDLVIDFINKEPCLKDVAVVYGSSIWGMHRNILDQHTRRSDIDVALSAWMVGKELAHGYRKVLNSFCEETSQQMHVPIEKIVVGVVGIYDGWINPSTNDHFRLLAKRFPKGPYKEFANTMGLYTKDRREDLAYYFNNIQRYCENLAEVRTLEEWDFKEPPISELFNGAKREYEKRLTELIKDDNCRKSYKHLLFEERVRIGDFHDECFNRFNPDGTERRRKEDVRQ